MFKLTIVSLIFAIFSGEAALAINIGSDTSGGSQTFAEALSFDGYFERYYERTLTKKELENRKRTIWSFNYTFSRATTPNPNGGDPIVDNTTEVDLSVGKKKKNDFEAAIGFTYAITPDENLKDYGPNIYFGQTFALAPRSDENFFPALGYKLTLSDLTYLQTFGTNATSRLGKAKPGTGSSSIGQFFPALQLTYDAIETLTIKGEYTHYFYNRNVNDFLATLDSPRAVSVGIFGLTNSVSSFNTDLFELDINWFPLEAWEFDEEITAATSAIDGTTPWTFKESALYDFAKNWTAGLSFEYEQSDILLERLYTLTVKYSSD